MEVMMTSKHNQGSCEELVHNLRNILEKLNNKWPCRSIGKINLVGCQMLFLESDEHAILT